MVSTNGEIAPGRKLGKAPARKTSKNNPAINKLSKAAGKKVEENSARLRSPCIKAL